MRGDKERNLREHGDEHHGDHGGQQKRPDSLENGFHLDPRSGALQDEHIEPDGGRDQPDLQNNHHEYAEPDWIEFQGLDDRKDDRQRQNHDRIDLHHAAQQQVGDNDGEEDQSPRQRQAGHEFAQRGRQSGQGQEIGKHTGADDDQKDKGRHFAGLRQAEREGRHGQFALDQRNTQCTKGTDPGRFRGRKNTGINPTDDNGEQQQHTPGTGQGFNFYRPAGRRTVRSHFRFDEAQK